MICPACQAENPAGTKICVKCGQDLPQSSETASTSTFASDPSDNKPAKPKLKFGFKDMARDVVDFCWLLLIIFLVFLGFLGEVTHWTFHFAETQQAQIHVKPALIKPMFVKHVKHRAAPDQAKVAPEITEAPETTIVESPEVQYGNPSSFYKKGKRQYDLHHYQASFTNLRQALEIDPTYAQAYFGLGYLYARFAMNDAAVRMYEMALRFDPSHSEAMNNLAMMYFQAGNYDDALELLQRAVAMGDSADFEYDLGSVYLLKNDLDNALQSFLKAVAMRPNDASIFNNMAVTYEKLGKKQEAMDSWNKVLKYSDNPDLLQQAKTHLDFLQAQS
jgi:Flp pilus assembly protein TadD